MLKINELKNLISQNYFSKDFKLKKEIQGFSWTKTNQHEIEKILLGYRVNQGIYYLYKPGFTITFPEIELKIQNAMQSLGLSLFNLNNYTLKSPWDQTLNIDPESFTLPISNSESFNTIYKSHLKYYELVGSYFFSHYKDLKNVANLLSPLSNEEIVPYIQGSILYVKTILILKEVNHPNYENKRGEFHLKLKGNEKYKDLLILFEHLFF